MPIETLIQEFTKSVVDLTAAINRQTDVLVAQGAGAAAKPTKTKTATTEPAPAPAPAAEAPAPAPAPAPEAAAEIKVDMQTLTRKAMEMVKADGGKKDRLLQVMAGIDPDATSIPTVKPANFAALHAAIADELVNNLLKA